MRGTRERLKALRGVGQRSSAREQPTPSAANRIRRARGEGTAAPRDAAELAARLGGVLRTPGLIERASTWSLNRPWGAHPIRPPERFQLPELPEGTPANWVCLDTETNGLAGGTGTIAFLVGRARLTETAVTVVQWLITAYASESDLLDCLAEDVARADGWISYNGKSFDGPVLATRWRLAGRPDPLAEQPHVDLLHPMRRAFRRHWPDCRLETAERQLLDYRRVGDVGGAEAPRIWDRFVRRGDWRPMAGLLTHHRRDLVSLVALACRLDAVHRDPAAWAADRLAIARAYRQRGALDRVSALLEVPDASPRERHELAEAYRRAGDTASARAIWSELAAGDDAHALAALSKHYEHQARDPQTALGFAERLPPGPDREQRVARLRRRLGPAGHAAGGRDPAPTTDHRPTPGAGSF